MGQIICGKKHLSTRYLKDNFENFFSELLFSLGVNGTVYFFEVPIQNLQSSGVLIGLLTK